VSGIAFAHTPNGHKKKKYMPSAAAAGRDKVQRRAKAEADCTSECSTAYGEEISGDWRVLCQAQADLLPRFYHHARPFQENFR